MEEIENTGVHELVTEIKNNTPLNTRHSLRYLRLQIKKKYKDYDSATAFLEGGRWQLQGTGGRGNPLPVQPALEVAQSEWNIGRCSCCPGFGEGVVAG